MRTTPSQLTHRRWFTCTPVDFSGGPDFFARDSGLVCRGFQTLGLVSRAIMPGAPREPDEPDLIRTDPTNLRSADWWRKHQLDGVVLYAWGKPKFFPIARAIHKAGIRLVLNQDSAGIVSPLNGLATWLAERNARLGPLPRGIPRISRHFRTTADAFYQLAVVDPIRLLHLLQGDVISCVSPTAAARFRAYLRVLQPLGLPNRVRLIPHPVNPIYRYNGTTKTPRIIVVGRWDDHRQKRPKLLMKVAAALLAGKPEVEMDIVGNITPELDDWHRNLDTKIADRIHLTGRLTPEVLAMHMNAAQVVYCSSAHESFHIASGEGLCSGCSVVSSRAPSLASFEWFTSHQSGTLAEQDTPEQHQIALEQELRHWKEGRRNPAAISDCWVERLHAPNVAHQILRLFPDLSIQINDPDHQ